MLNLSSAAVVIGALKACRVVCIFTKQQFFHQTAGSVSLEWPGYSWLTQDLGSDLLKEKTVKGKK